MSPTKRMYFSRTSVVAGHVLGLLLAVVSAAPAHAQTPTSSTCPEIISTLRLGMVDANTLPPGQISELQDFLAERYNLAIDNTVTGYFGPKTLLYTIRFQQEQRIRATGTVGPLTRAKIRAMCTEPEVGATGEVKTVLSGLYNAYSPTVLTYNGTTRMWIGGWAKVEDYGADVMYYSDLQNGQFAKPVEAFRLTDYAVNDPSVVVNPTNSAELLMFFTVLKTENATGALMTSRNWVASMKSVDGGKSWKDFQIVIGQNNGLDERGAWSPSALVVGNEIWLYYNTNSPGTPDIYRTRLRVADLSVIDTTATTKDGVRISGINVDVSKFRNTYTMLVGASLRDINRYTSVDGLVWIDSPSPPNPVLQATENSAVVTPTIVVEGDKQKIYYSGGPYSPDGTYRFSLVHQVDNPITARITYTSPDHSVTSIPDYIVTNVEGVSSGGVGVGALSAVAVTIKNQGGDLGNTAIAVQALSPQLPVFQTYILPLRAGETRTVNLPSVNPSFEYSAGSFEYTVKVNVTNAVVESSTTNNEFKKIITLPIAVPPTLNLTTHPCVVGQTKSAIAPDNILVCDSKVSWSTTDATSAYVTITGDFPYNTSNFPYGYVAGTGLTGTDTTFWTVAGSYKATLYINGTPPTKTTPGTGTAIADKTFTVTSSWPDYVVTSVGFKLRPGGGGGAGAIEFATATVKNIGGDKGNASVSVVAGVYGLPNYQTSILPIPAGESRVATLSNSMPYWNVPEGTYQFTTSVNTTNTVVESDKSNNSFASSVSIVPATNTTLPTPPTTPPVLSVPTGTLSVTPCTIGGALSVLNPGDASVCDSTITWSTTNATSAYISITGSSPYLKNIYPYGYTTPGGYGKSGNNVPFWTPAGTYTVSLYVNGDYSNSTTVPNTGVRVDSQTITVLPRVSATRTTQQVAAAALAITRTKPPTTPSSVVPSSTPVQLTHSLAVGWTGPEVVMLQTHLKQLGFLRTEVTGYFGELTKQAVIDYQQAHNLPSVGVVGPITRQLLAQ